MRASRISTASSSSTSPTPTRGRCKLRSGEADVADSIPYNQVQSLESTDGINVEVADSLKWDSIFLNTKEAPLDEVEVRQALTTRPRRIRSSKTVLFGNGTVANSQIPQTEFWDESIDPYPYDIAKAQELIVAVERPERLRPRAPDPVG